MLITIGANRYDLGRLANRVRMMKIARLREELPFPIEFDAGLFFDVETNPGRDNFFVGQNRFVILDRLLVSDAWNLKDADFLARLAVWKADHDGDSFRGIENRGLPPFASRILEPVRKRKHGGNRFGVSKRLASNGDFVVIMFSRGSVLLGRAIEIRLDGVTQKLRSNAGPGGVVRDHVVVVRVRDLADAIRA